MRHSKVYLAGGIFGLTDDECHTWRDVAKDKIGVNRCLDPMDRDYRGIEDESFIEIVEADKDDIRKSEVLLVNAVNPSWGTAMEVLYAFILGKYIVIIAGDEKISPWLRYHASYKVKTLEDGINEVLYMLNIKSGGEI